MKVARVAVGAGAVALAALLFTTFGPRPAGPPRLLAIGPRLISNQTSYPVMLHGEFFRPGMRLRVGDLELDTAFVDDRRVAAVIPAGFPIPPAQAISELDVELVGAEGRPAITIVNDMAFRTPLDLEAAEGRIFVASRTSDEILVIDPGGEVRSIPTGDGPRSLALYRDEAGVQWLVIACEFGGELRLMRTSDPDSPQRRIAVAPSLQSVAVSGSIAWVTEHRTETVLAVDLVGGRVIERIESPVDPRPLALLGDRMLIGNVSTEDLTLVRIGEKSTRRVAPAADTPIVGGHTEPFAAYVMGGKRPRAVIASDRLGVFFVTSVGPNVGPNPERMEVTMNGGVGVVDAEGRFLRHVALRQGLPEGMAIDDERGLLFVADVSTGRVEILDAASLVESDERARSAFVAEIEIPPSEDTPRLREASDFGREGRATESLHSGPFALRLADGGRTLLVLSRFSGSVQAVDVSAKAAPALGARVELPGHDSQPARRLGEIAYYTDLGNSRMSCDACHPDGGTGGVLFTKGAPMRIYRSPTMRGVRDTAPYFTPSMLPTLRHMARDVLGRNRYYNPRPTKAEIAALAHYTQTIVPLPNPWLEADGALPRRLDLPGGGTGDAVAGLAIFDANGCESCHPAPQFSTDQDAATRGRLHHAGTPLALPLRTGWQDMARDPGWPPVSLVGAWDTFPLLSSGAGGLAVEGDAVVPLPGLPLRRVLRSPLADGDAHGAAARLSEQQRDDLVAYLLTL